MSRHTKTTRRNRRVVWLLLSVLGIFAFIVFRLGTLWFSRGEILSLAPTDTVFAVHFQLTESTSPFLNEWLSGIPLLSQRSIELRDVLPYTKGEIALFITKDGRRSIAIRGDKSAIDPELLSQYSISAQEQGGFVLLSETLLPISGIPSLTHRSFFPSIGKRWLGRIVLPEEQLGGNIFKTDDYLSFEFETGKQSPNNDEPIPNLGLSLSGLSWDGETPLKTLEYLLIPFKQDDAEKPLFLDENSQMEVFIRQTSEGRETLLIQKGTNPTTEVLIRELQLIGALAKPSIKTSILPDGSLFEEIEVQPDLISVEEISTSIGLSYRVSTNSGSIVIATIHNNDLLLSNNQDLLETYGKTKEVSGGLACAPQSNYLSPSFLLSETSSDYFNPDLSFYHQVFSVFSHVSIEFKKYSTAIYLCTL